MGPWSYYAPFWIGLLLPFGMHQAVFAHPTVAALSPAMQWGVLVLFALALGIEFQLCMIGAQGAFAQVLPAPGGRSIRGRGAVVTGALILASIIPAWVVQLLWTDTFTVPVMVIGALGLAAGITAIIVYLWCWPMAVRDFANR